MRDQPVPHPIDEQGFALFLQRAEPEVRRLLRRLCTSHADADDVLQETLAKVWRLRAGFDAQQNGTGWLLQAAFRCFCDHRQRLRREPRTAGSDDLVAPACHDDLELRDEVRHRLGRLPPLERELLVGFHAHGHSLRDLAARHGLPLNTVKSHLHRARARLQQEHHAQD